MTTAPASPEDSSKPLIQIITMNGFTILDSEDARQEPNERRFLVKSPVEANMKCWSKLMKKPLATLSG